MGLRPNVRYAFWAASWKISCMVPAPPGANTMPAVATASIPSSRMLFEKYFAMCEANWLIGSPAVTHEGIARLSPPGAKRSRMSSAAPM